MNEQPTNFSESKKNPRKYAGNVSVFFFCLRKSSLAIHSFNFITVFFFSGAGKKKKQHFHSFIRFSPKSAQKRTFPGKKKYDTFARALKKLTTTDWGLQNQEIWYFSLRFQDILYRLGLSYIRDCSNMAVAITNCKKP